MRARHRTGAQVALISRTGLAQSRRGRWVTPRGLGSNFSDPEWGQFCTGFKIQTLVSIHNVTHLWLILLSLRLRPKLSRQ